MLTINLPGQVTPTDKLHKVTTSTCMIPFMENPSFTTTFSSPVKMDTISWKSKEMEIWYSTKAIKWPQIMLYGQATAMEKDRDLILWRFKMTEMLLFMMSITLLLGLQIPTEKDKLHSNWSFKMTVMSFFMMLMEPQLGQPTPTETQTPSNNILMTPKIVMLTEESWTKDSHSKVKTESIML